MIDGSAVAAWKETLTHGAPFSTVLVADRHEHLVSACESRLKAWRAPVGRFCGEAVEVVDDVIRQLDPHALHCVLLDPFNLESLDFSIIQKLSTFKRMDIIVHLSAGDGTRNAADYVDLNSPRLDGFAPGWSAFVNAQRGKQTITQQLFQYWLESVKGLGFTVSGQVDELRNQNNALLYWLLFVCKHPLPDQLWRKTADNPQGDLF